MNPMVVACQSGLQGRGRPSASRRINRQRIVRTGKVMVAMMTVSTSRTALAWRASAQTSRRLMRCSTQASSATLTTSPISQAHRQRCCLLGLEGEDNEVADFVNDDAKVVPAGAFGRLAEFLCALAGAIALVEERSDIDGLTAVASWSRDSLE